jgi:hypothetical protein
MRTLLIAFPGFLLCGTTLAAPSLDASFGNITLAFTVNRGQSPSSIRFTAQGGGCGMAFSPAGTTFLLSRETAASVAKRAAKKSVMFEDDPTRDQPEYESFALELAFVGANENPEIQGEDRLPWNNNYFIGNDPDRWRTDVPNYKKIRFREVYDGVDLVYYGNRKRVKYDFVVKPGEDPEKILLKYDFGEAGGALAVNEKGELVVKTPVGELIEEKPYCYQKINGKEAAVEVRYEVVEGGIYRFRVGEYDKSAELVIDPELVYSTYLGGIYREQATGVAIDKEGCVYVVGSTDGDFPITSGALNSTPTTMFLAKINPAGTSLVYSTYFGRNDLNGTIAGIAVDNEGNAYVAGSGVGSEFPTTSGAYDTQVAGYTDCYVTKINTQGNGLIYSTYIGGSSSDFIHGITIDSAGNAFVCGYTNSSDFPTTSGTYREKITTSGIYEAFITKLNRDGTGLQYSSYLGQTGLEDISIAIDTAGNAFVAGVSGHSAYGSYPVTPDSYSTPGGKTDIFITKMNDAGSGVFYSCLFGGGKNDYVTGIAVDSSGNAYISGYTESADYPTTPGAFQETYRGDGDRYNGFLTKLNSEGSALVFSTYVHGDSDKPSTIVMDLSVNQAGESFVTGNSDAFPVTTDAYQKLDRGAFLALFSSKGDSLIYSTCFGGSRSESGEALAIRENGDVVIAGFTDSLDFPVTAGAVDDTLTYFDLIAIHPDAFIAKFHFEGGFTAVGSFKKPSEFSITGVYPNPFNPSTTIMFSLPEPGGVTFSVYSVSGQKVYESKLNFYERGQKQIRFEGKDSFGHALSSGVYMVRFEFGKNSDARKMMLIK